MSWVMNVDDFNNVNISSAVTHCSIGFTHDASLGALQFNLMKAPDLVSSLINFVICSRRLDASSINRGSTSFMTLGTF